MSAYNASMGKSCATIELFIYGEIIGDIFPYP